MRGAVKEFLKGIVAGLVLRDGTRPYPAAGFFYGELARDYLKDHDFAVSCLPLQDRKLKEGRLIGRQRNLVKTGYTVTRRRYRREILLRCFFWAAGYEDLWGADGFTGLVDQFEQAVAGTRVLADSGNCAVRVDLQDAVRPFDSDSREDRSKRRQHLAIVRLRFTGGVQTSEFIPIVRQVEITPAVGPQ